MRALPGCGRRGQHEVSLTSVVEDSEGGRIGPILYKRGKHKPNCSTLVDNLYSGGLAPSGDPSGDCDSSTGQVYARATTYNDAFAIMYAWYMPKDSPSSGLGHRHDWEGIVVWLSEESTSATLLGVAASAHGDFSTTTSPNLSGTSPLIRYYSVWPVDHQLGFTSTVGGQQPLIAYESLTDAARTALENTDFGDANVPFKDANLENNLAKAVL